MSTTVRSFIAIELPQQVRRQVAALQRELRVTKPKVSWTREDKLHLTLKFFGDVEQRKMNRLKATLQELATEVTGFQFKIAGVGLFPNARKARILWLGVEDPRDRLNDLYEKIRKQLINFDFSEENPKFKAHLTIGRVRASLSRDFVLNFLATRFEGGMITVNEFVLMQSELRTSGAVYTPLARIALKKL